MILDRTTYEAWLLDRIEGNLTPAQERELDAFLAENPDLGTDITGLPTIDAGASDPIDWKNGLKKRLPPTGMPDVSRLNEFLVARLEGDLDKTQELALHKFLFEHPEHEQDAKRVAASKSVAEQVPFGHKPTIERNFPPQGIPDAHRLTDFLIAAQEGDLSPEQQHALVGYLAAHPEARRDERLVAAARVTSERIIFRGKEGLKKREVRVIALWQRYAAAASIALLLGFAWWVMRGEQADGPAIARKEKVTPVLPEKNTTQDPGTQVQGKQKEQRPQGPEGETLREPKQGHEGEQGAAGSRPHLREDAPVGKDGDPAEQQQPAPFVVPVDPEPEPQFVESPEPVQQEPAPALAQDPLPTPKEESQGTQVAVLQEERPATASVDHPSEGGTPVGTVLANTVRNGVLETGARNEGLDRDDALAMVNKGLGAITGGEGGVEVQRKTTRDRWKVRLGKNLAISASTGR